MLFLIVLSLNKPVTLEVKAISEFSIQKYTKGSYIFEDFETWPLNTFTLIPATGTGAWQQSPMNSAYYISPQTGASGDYAAEFDCWSYSAGTTGDMISDPVDLVGATSPNLSFYFWNHRDLTGYGNNDSTIVSISTNGGGNWSDIMILKGNVDDWTQQIYSLDSYIGDTIIIRFRGVSDWGGSNMGIDMVELGQRPSIDAGINKVLKPGDYEEPGIPFTPICEIKSVGTDTVYDFYTHLLIDSMGILINKDSVLIDTLFHGKNDTLIFPQVTLSPDFYYEFTYFTVLMGDEYSLNDTVIMITRCYTSERLVIGELATNTGCSPCKPANDTLDKIFPDYPDNLALVRYHAWWPSSVDPFYQYNISENRARINYYGADYVPHFHIDGDIDAGSARNSWRTLIEEETQKPSPIDLDVAGFYHSYNDAGSLYVTVNATGEPIESNLFLRFYLVENGIQYSAPNGQSVFYQTFRDMFPNTTGLVIGELHYGESFVCSLGYTVDAALINEDSAEIIVIMQSDDNKHILQGGRMTLLAGVKEDSRSEESLKILNVPSIIVGKGNSEIKFSLESASSVNVLIYDITGRQIINLIESNMDAGIHKISIEPENLTPGLYFIMFNYNYNQQMRKVVVLK